MIELYFKLTAELLIEMHKEERVVRDRADGKQGSEFWITLPIVSEKNETAERLL